MEPDTSNGSRRRRQRGNALIEGGLIMLPFLALVFAITDYSLALFVRTTLQHAVREGARYAVTYQVMGGLCQDASIKETVRQNAMGFITSANVNNNIFVRYYTPDTFTLTAANAPGNIVEISVENFQWQWIAPLWRVTTPMTVVVRSSDVMEGLPGGSSAPCR